jgi:hypothetical protein
LFYFILNNFNKILFLYHQNLLNYTTNSIESPEKTRDLFFIKKSKPKYELVNWSIFFRHNYVKDQIEEYKKNDPNQNKKWFLVNQDKY